MPPPGELYQNITPCDSGQLAPCYENMMSSTNLLTYCSSAIRGKQAGNMHKNSAKTGQVFFELCEWREKQTDRHTHDNIRHPSQGQNSKNYKKTHLLLKVTYQQKQIKKSTIRDCISPKVCSSKNNYRGHRNGLFYKPIILPLIQAVFDHCARYKHMLSLIHI